MSMTMAPERVELDESLLDALAPCDWQNGHRSTRTDCLIDATHLMAATCTPALRFRGCDIAARIARLAMAEQTRCRYCNRPTRVCWSVVPI